MQRKQKINVDYERSKIVVIETVLRMYWHDLASDSGSAGLHPSRTFLRRFFVTCTNPIWQAKDEESESKIQIQHLLLFRVA